MKRGFLALLIVVLALITALVACGGRYPSERSGCSGCGGCGLGCAACTACVAAGCALSCARGLFDTAQTGYTGIDYH